MNEGSIARTWTAHVETLPGFTFDALQLEALQDALTDADEAHDAAPPLDHEQGVLSATFQVEAPSAARAETIATVVFYWALVAALDQPGWKFLVDIETGG